LDQFLEHLLAIGIEKIVRIGGRSQSAILEGKNISIVSQGETKTRFEGYRLAKTYEGLEAAEKSISKQLRFLHSAQKRPDWANIKNHLANGYPRIHAQLARVDDDGFETVGRDPFDVWVSDKSPTVSDESEDGDAVSTVRELLEIAMQNVHRLSLPDRHQLMEHWMQEMREIGTDKVFELVRSAEIQSQLLSCIHDDVDRRVLQTADVIGVTTTGLVLRPNRNRLVRSREYARKGYTWT